MASFANLSRFYRNDFAGALLGPVPGMLTGLSSGILSGVTTDIFLCIIRQSKFSQACLLD